jgi:predicted  nucleic acid-binding Zn-ribbon protein
MPHQCTNCERVFPDGSKEMLSGCPDCGGNKFQFRPDPAADPPTLGDDAPAEATDPTSAGSAADAEPSTPGPSVRSDPDASADRTATRTAASPDPADADGELIEAESDPSALGGPEPTPGDGPEDTAQADARSDVVTRDELDRAAAPSPPESVEDAARTVPPDADASPGIDDLREELNDQFESIKIVEPGQYELNLMELYDRQECIISLQEDGHYVIEVADTWRDD